MKKIIMLICIFSLLVFVGTAIANPISVLNRDTVKDDSKERLFKDWGTHYSLIKTLLEADMKAYDCLSARPLDSVSDEVMSRLLNEWYPHMSLIKTLYDADMKAYKSLQ